MEAPSHNQPMCFHFPSSTPFFFFSLLLSVFLCSFPSRFSFLALLSNLPSFGSLPFFFFLFSPLHVLSFFFLFFSQNPPLHSPFRLLLTKGSSSPPPPPPPPYTQKKNFHFHVLMLKTWECGSILWLPSFFLFSVFSSSRSLFLSFFFFSHNPLFTLLFGSFLQREAPPPQKKKLPLPCFNA